MKMRGEVGLSSIQVFGEIVHSEKIADQRQKRDWILQCKGQV